MSFFTACKQLHGDVDPMSDSSQRKRKEGKRGREREQEREWEREEERIGERRAGRRER